MKRLLSAYASDVMAMTKSDLKQSMLNFKFKLAGL